MYTEKYTFSMKNKHLVWNKLNWYNKIQNYNNKSILIS